MRQYYCPTTLLINHIKGIVKIFKPINASFSIRGPEFYGKPTNNELIVFDKSNGKGTT